MRTREEIMKMVNDKHAEAANAMETHFVVMDAILTILLDIRDLLSKPNSKEYMEKESITIKIELESGHITSPNHFRDRREITVQTTRGEISKKIDEICADIEAGFEQ